MRLTRISFIAFFVLLLGVNSLKASHVPGGNITYECVGPNQYLVTLTLFEDCAWAFEGSGNQFLTATNTCGLANPSISLPNTVYQQEVSQLCPSQAGQSSCQGGSLPGVWMHQWQAVITLPAECDTWTFAYSSCCRNTTTNLSGQPGYYWATTLNSQTAPCNSSAQITSPPIPYVCVNQPVSFNMGALDPDGNTLTYQLVNALTGATTPVTYNAGYNGTVPIPGVTIDPNTGQITFTPTITGNFVFAVIITEYDANGNIVGTVTQDFQFIVINCTNQVPQPPAAGIVNFVGQGAITATNSIEVCEGDNFCFDLVFTDPNPADILIVTSNITQTFPNATVTYVGTNPVTATVCGTVQTGAPPASVISFQVEDNACPIAGISAFPVLVNVISSTFAGLDVTMCEGVGVQLNAGGGSNFQWTALVGDPIVVGTNFSCNPCQDPIANPSVTTTYEVVSNLSGGCTNRDTITVTVVPDFQYNLTQSSTTSCLLDPISVNITPVPAGAYTYSWSPAAGLSSSTSPNPTITQTIPGTYNYTVTMTSALGCVKTDNISITVAPAYAPQITATASANVINCGDQVQLTTDLGGGVPASCGPSTSGGCPPGAGTPISVGTQSGTNSSTAAPSPYQNWYANARHQFLYTAAELQAAGFVGGKIGAIQWQTTAQNGAISTFINYRISVGCTNLNSLTTNFEGGLTQVFGPQNVNVVLGQNTHNFTTAYDWDGISNLIVEICYEWTAQYSYTYNWSVPFTNTAFNSTLYFQSDGTVACPNPTGITMTQRPVTTFLTCPSVPDPNNFTYSWTPALGSNGVTTPTTQNTSASPVNPTWYVITATDINGGCTGVDSVFVDVDCCDAPTLIGTDPTCTGASNGTITYNANGTGGPFDIEVLDGAGNVIQTHLGVAAGQSFTLTGLPAGSYTVSTTDQLPCTSSESITLIDPVGVSCCDPSVIVGVNTVCAGSSDGQISTTPTGPNAPFEVTITNSVGVAVYNNTGIVQGQTDVATGLTAGTYTVDVLDATGCIFTEVVTLTSPAPFSVTTQDVTICITGSTTLIATANGGVAPHTCTWTGVGTGTPTVSPLANECFEVIATDANGCNSTSANLCVTLNPPLSGTVNANVTAVCPGAPVNLVATGAGGNGGPYTITWWQDGVFVAGGNTTMVNPVFATDPEAGGIVTYCMVVDDGCETPNDTNCVDITVFPTANVTFTSDVVDGCFPVIVNFTNTTNPAFTGGCTWNFGDGTTSTDCNPTHGYLIPGAYTVTLDIVSPGGCTGTLTQVNYINVYGYPNADFTYNPQVGTILNSEITFTNTSTNNTYNLWSFGSNGELGTSNDVNPQFAFPVNNPGTYPVTLYVENQHGCADSTSLTIIIEGIFTLYVPNAFTPDGDGLNDMFKPVGDGVDVEDYRLMIFNRWGEPIWETRDFEAGWDGQSNGYSSPDGVYVWKIITRDRFTDERKQFVGHVTLVR